MPTTRKKARSARSLPFATGIRLCVLGALLVQPAAVRATELTHFNTVRNTDFALFGAGGMRGQGTGSIVVTGISGNVRAAYLFWQGPTNDAFDSNASVTFNGMGITGVAMGVTASNGWPFTNSKAYRATVTGLVAGNGTYSLSNFIKTGPPAAEINGATLLVFYNDPNPANDRDVVIYTGNDSNTPNVFDADGWNATVSGINFPGGTVNMQLVVSDGQALPDDELKVNGTTLLSSGGSSFQGLSVPDQGTAATTNGGLWDHRTFDVTALVSPGLNTLQIEPTLYVNDSLSLVAVIVDSVAALPAASSNANLGSLTISAGSLTPGFNGGTLAYTAFVSNATDSMTVTPTVADATASVTVNGTAVASGSASGAIGLAVGSNVITVVVTAQDGTTTRTYTIDVTRQGDPLPPGAADAIPTLSGGMLALLGLLLLLAGLHLAGRMG